MVLPALCALLLQQGAPTSVTPPVMHFARKFKPAKRAFKLVQDFKFGELAGSLTAQIQVAFWKNDEDGNPIVRMTTLEYASTRETHPSAKPDEFMGSISKLNIPDACHLTLHTTDMIYLFLNVAGMTTGRDVKPGDKLPVEWKSTAQNLRLKGMGTVGPANASGGAHVDWDLAMTTDGQDWGKFVFSSDYDPVDCSLLKSAGAFIVAADVRFPITIERVDL